MQLYHVAVLKDGLAVAGKTQSFPGAIIHAPYKYYYGLNLTDMFTEQGIQHLLAVLQFGHSSDNLTGCLIHGSMEAMAVKIGTLVNPFTLDYDKMHPLATNDSWTKIWEFQQHHNIQI